MLKRGQVIKGRRAIPSPHARDWYARRMKLLVQVMDGRMRVYFNKTGETLTPSDREELARLRVRFTNLFGEEARPMATAFFNKNITYTKSSFRAATKPIVEATEQDLRARKRNEPSSAKKRRSASSSRRKKRTLISSERLKFTPTKKGFKRGAIPKNGKRGAKRSAAGKARLRRSTSKTRKFL